MHGAATDVQMLDGQPPCTGQPMAAISRLSQSCWHIMPTRIFAMPRGLIPYEMVEKYGHEAAAMLIEKAMVAGNA